VNHYFDVNSISKNADWRMTLKTDVILARLAIRSYRSRVTTGEAWSVGQVEVACTEVDPQGGKVFLGEPLPKRPSHGGAASNSLRPAIWTSTCPRSLRKKPSASGLSRITSETAAHFCVNL
jgi:hypothetical protein